MRRYEKPYTLNPKPDTMSNAQIRQGVQFISTALEREKRGPASVYVHCRRGRVRCVMMCTAFLMVTFKLTPIDAEALVLR